MAITGTEQPSSPSIVKKPSNNKVYTRVFKYARDYAWEAEMPATGSLDATYGYFRNYTSSNAEAYVTVTLIYDSEGSGSNFTPADGDSEYWAETVGEEKPVEYHASYLTNWNYRLYGKNDGGAVKVVGGYPGPNTWANSTTIDDLVGQDAYIWSKALTLNNYYLIATWTKGNQFYLAPTRSVFQRDYHRQECARCRVAVRHRDARVGHGRQFPQWIEALPKA